MSLTSFVRQTEVRSKFRTFVKKPTIAKNSAQLLAPNRSKHYLQVGTAFDYLFRFFIKHVNLSKKISEGIWISERAVDMFCGGKDKYSRLGVDIITDARYLAAKYIQDGKMSDDLIIKSLQLATLDNLLRGSGERSMIGFYDPASADDLWSIYSILDGNKFIVRDHCYLNPKFGSASKLVGGADADIIMDNMVLEIKTVSDLALRRDQYNALVGYHILNKIHRIYDSNAILSNTDSIGVYFARFGYLWVVELNDIISEENRDEFTIWFLMHTFNLSRHRQGFPPQQRRPRRV